MNTEILTSAGLAQRAIALIASGKAIRDDRLAWELDTDMATICAALAPACASGALVSCKIERVGSTPVNEYRLSAAGPRKADDSHLKKPPTPPAAVLAAAKAAPVSPPRKSAPPQPSTEGDTMSAVERILAAFEKHGPMTVKEARKHADVAWIGVTCAQFARKGKLVRLGGGPKSSIYGLPGQKLPKGESAAAATAPARRKKATKVKHKKRSAPVRKVQRKTAPSARRPRVLIKPEKDFRATPPAGGHLRIGHADLGKQYADGPAGFRTAIASDGAMLFLGAAAGPFELTRPESRALIEFVRTLDAGMLAA